MKNKKNIQNIYTKEHYSLWQGENPASWDNTDGPRGHDAKWNKPDRGHIL